MLLLIVGELWDPEVGESSLASDPRDGSDPRCVGFLKLQSLSFSRSRKFADRGKITENTGKHVRFGFLNILGFGCFRKIRGYPLQKSFYFMSVGSVKNFKVIHV